MRKEVLSAAIVNMTVLFDVRAFAIWATYPHG